MSLRLLFSWVYLRLSAVFLLECLTHGACELIGARSALTAAQIAAENIGDIIDCLTLTELGYRLEIAVAASRKADIVNAVSVELKVYFRGACTFCLIAVLHVITSSPCGTVSYFCVSRPVFRVPRPSSAVCRIVWQR